MESSDKGPSVVVPPTGVDGLDPATAAALTKTEGPNLVTRAAPRRFGRLVFELVTEPMIALLLVLVVLYLILGELREAIAMSASVMVIIVLTLFQEWRTERAVNALRDLAAPRALVIRGGERHRIAGSEVVRGDRVVLEEGDRVPADGVLVPGKNGGEPLRIDESLLTGESVPVERGEGEQVFGSTLVVGGRAQIVVTHIGDGTRVGKLGAALGELTPEVSPLRIQVDRLVRIFGAVAVIACLVLVAGLWLTGTELVPALLSGIGLAIGLIPEEYPVVLTVFLALGAFRMAREHVLVRRLPAIEALGSATVLSTDKTGTLTENRMTVTEVWTAASGRSEPTSDHPEVRRALAVAAMASRRETVEPMDAAMWAVVPALRAESATWTLVHDYPFGRDPGTGQRELTAARAFQVPGRANVVVAVKGAPEAVLELCSIGEPERAAVIQAAGELAAEGLRVLAVTEIEHRGEAPVDRHALPFASSRWVGLVGIEDPVRSDVPEAVAAVQHAGIRMLMITGDAPETARAVAIKAGIQVGEVVRGSDVEALSDVELVSAVARWSVIARAAPEHKLRVVQALASRGDVVAMTGDGVNDALALKASAIGIAMGGRGTDVAREAAAIVLTDDRFASIVSGLRRGRRIFANLQRASAFIFVVHIVLVGVVLLSAALGLPPALLPLHIVGLELLIDPACSVVFEAEPEPPGLMDRPPRSRTASLLDRSGIVASLLVGGVALTVVTALHAHAIAAGVSAEASRFAVFAGMVTTIVVTIFASRSGAPWQGGRPNLAYLGLLVGALVALALAIAIAPVRAALHWELPEPSLLLTSVGLSALGVVSAHALARLYDHFAPPAR